MKLLLYVWWNRTVLLLQGFMLHSSRLHILPHLSSHCAPYPIGSNNKITLIDGLIRTTDHNLFRGMLYLSHLLVHQNTMSFVSEALVQNAEQNLAIKERNRITVSIESESPPVYEI